MPDFMKNRLHTTLCNRSNQRGVGLIEVLIAVVVMSLGFLASSRMQVQGMRYSQNAYFESQANLLVNDMIDRMRTNITGVIDGHYDNKSTSAGLTSPDCGASVCTVLQHAQQDLYDWSAHLHAPIEETLFRPTLPSSTGIAATGSVTAVGNNVYRVSMTWSTMVDGTDVARTLSMNFAAEVPD